jgi:hypothetical protein
MCGDPPRADFLKSHSLLFAFILAVFIELPQRPHSYLIYARKREKIKRRRKFSLSCFDFVAEGRKKYLIFILHIICNISNRRESKSTYSQLGPIIPFRQSYFSLNKTIINWNDPLCFFLFITSVRKWISIQIH